MLDDVRDWLDDAPLWSKIVFAGGAAFFAFAAGRRVFARGAPVVIVNGERRRAPVGISWTNWQDGANVDRLNAPEADRLPVSEIVLHESVTKSAEDTQRILKNRGLGVHIMIDRDGTVTQHGDLARDVTYHMPGHNRQSVGIEIVNPYHPRHAKPTDRWISAPWAHDDEYVLPTLEQMQALRKVIDTVSELVSVPLTFPALEGNTFWLDKIEKPAQPGIWAHHHIGGHSDAAFPALVMAMSITRNQPVEAVYEEAVELATGARDRVTI